MKIFALDWRNVLARLPEWEALSPAARRDFMEVKPSGVDAAVVWEGNAELQRAGMITATAKRAVVTAPYHTLLIALRAMNRVEAMDAVGAPLHTKYLEDHFTEEELKLAVPHPYTSYGWVDRNMVAARVSSEEWLEEFLALEELRAAKRWEKSRLLSGEASRFAVRGRWEAVRALVQALAKQPRGVPLGAFGTLLPELDDAERADVLETAIRFLLVFPRIRVSGPEAIVGLVPAAVGRLGPPPPPPTLMAAAELFDAPYLGADMTTVLVEAATAPIPLRGSDGAMYVRSQKLLAPRLQPMPAWVWSMMSSGGEIDEEEAEEGSEQAAELLAARTVDGTRMLLNFGLARSGTDESDKLHLSSTKKGNRWLALPEGERLRELLDVFRASGERNPAGWYGTVTGREFFPARLPFELANVVDLRASLSEAFLSIPVGAMVSYAEFFHYHARTGNPFVLHSPEKLLGRAGFSSIRLTARAEWEGLWRELLDSFLVLRLVPFGGARLGLSADGVPCLGITPVGRYLLGAEDEWRYEPAPAGEVVVQPDFEILFLAPAPRLEAELARLADRIGSGVGALFRITRASVLRAAEQGLAADDAVALLEQVSRTPVPANVARQIRDWMAGTRRVSLKNALLIECPDPETAARVLALTSGHGEQITPTLLRIPTHALDRKTFARKLRERGIFITL